MRRRTTQGELHPRTGSFEAARTAFDRALTLTTSNPSDGICWNESVDCPAIVDMVIDRAFRPDTLAQSSGGSGPVSDAERQLPESDGDGE